jgi:signal transduction histidine kinase
MESKLPDQPVDLAGDRTRLQQVVWNLLGNAVKFTPPGKHVRTTLEADSSRAKIIVADEGDGINPDFLPHVFEAFEQDSTGKRAGGLGLGFHIVATIVSMHGGTIDAKSDGAGKGATFTVTLPLRVSSV